MWRSLKSVHCSVVAAALPAACFERYRHRDAMRCVARSHCGNHVSCSSSPPVSKEAVRDAAKQKLREVAVLHPVYKDDFGQYIPDFLESERCTQSLLGMLPLHFRGRPILFLTPDAGLDQLRIELDKQQVPYLMATLGIRDGIVWGAAEPEKRVAVSLRELQQMAPAGPLLVVVTGVIAVTEDGERLGKGHGYFDTEWALLSELQLVSPDTQVIAVAHDRQVIDQLPVAEAHDVKVDYVITPSRIIHTGATKVRGKLRWEALDRELAATPLFQDWRKLMSKSE